ncbi:hypothetical protein [Streptococcus sp. zg-JUN1979]|uniref:hypothetical protein n=1 Tax=Streptococcus sp. zg-JUN1979 TaxID=3391450 RepID=UPI0039A7766B
MYYVLKHDKDNVYLRDSNGQLTKLKRSLFDFEVKAGDRIELYQDEAMTVVVPFVEGKHLELNGEKSVKSTLLQGILDLFLETLSIHNTKLGNLKAIFSQFVITLFMAWSLLGVILIEILLFAESLVVFIWQLLVRAIKALHLVENSKKLFQKSKKLTPEPEEPTPALQPPSNTVNEDTSDGDVTTTND